MAFSIVPFPLNLTAALAPLVVPHWRVLRSAWLAGVTAVATVAVAVMLPVKHLDRKLPALHYGPTPLVQLSEALHRDHNFRVFVDSRLETSEIVELHTIEPVSRRVILNMLAEQTGARVDLRYCAAGATVLFGQSVGCSLKPVVSGRDPQSTKGGA